MQIGVVTVKRTGQKAIEQTITLNQQAKKQNNGATGSSHKTP